MKLFKSLLLASATGLVAVSGASAADLGAKKPSPVEFVRACYNPLWGTSGGFIIPGTQTCLRVFGQARFDMHYAQPFNRQASSPIGYRGGATIGLDAITPSEFGNVRAFASVAVTYRSGNQFSGGNIRNGFAIGDFLPAGQNARGQTEIMSTGFIQFAGFTMGRTSSFFATVGGSPEVIGTNFRSGPGNVITLAYTANLGNGFLATIAIEDPTTRRFGVASGTVVSPAGALILQPNGLGPLGVGITGVFPAPPAGVTAIAFPSQVGNRMPNIVAALRVDQAWGSAELSGMVNEIGLVGAIPGVGALAGQALSPSTRYGFAINGGLKINLPMLSAGSNLQLNAVYSEGNLSAALSNAQGNSAAGFNVGGVAVVAADAVHNRGTNALRLTKAWGVSAGLQYFWTPTISSTLFGSYGHVDVGNQPFDFSDTLRDFSYWNIGLNTIWQPVRGLNIAVEGVYVNLNPAGRMVDVNKHTQVNNTLALGACNTVTGANCRLKSSDGAFIARLRVTRDF